MSRRPHETAVVPHRPGVLQQQLLLDVHLLGLAYGDAEERRVEAVDAGDEGTATAVGARHPGAALLEVGVDVPTFGRDLGERVPAGTEQGPQLRDLADRAREITGHGDDRDIRVAGGGRVALRARVGCCLCRLDRLDGAGVGGLRHLNSGCRAVTAGQGLDQLGELSVLKEERRGKVDTPPAGQLLRQLDAHDRAHAVVRERGLAVEGRDAQPLRQKPLQRFPDSLTATLPGRAHVI